MIRDDLMKLADRMADENGIQWNQRTWAAELRAIIARMDDETDALHEAARAQCWRCAEGMPVLHGLGGYYHVEKDLGKRSCTASPSHALIAARGAK